MSIWYSIDNMSLDDLNALNERTLVKHIGIEITEVTPNSMKGKMPVDERTFQPASILHGGASVVLAETLGSIASNFIVEPGKAVCVGLSINANHLRPASSGYVYGEAIPIHLGKTTHVWNIDIVNEEGKMVCNCKLTMAVKKIDLFS
jgi:1,4-dihydroxy-2-naphthoyl-CoA hydrolase